MATGIEFDHAAVEALWPPMLGGAPTTPGKMRPGTSTTGSPSAGRCQKTRMGQPIIARAAALMAEWFDKNEPATPEPRSIYRWIRKNPHLHWW